MNIWNQLPLFRILIPFLAGIIFSVLFPSFFYIPALYVVIPGITLIVFAVWYHSIFKSFSNRWIFGVLLNAVVFLFACNLTVPRLIHDSSYDLENLKLSSDTVIATIDDPVIERENTYKVILEINAIKRNEKWQYAKGNVITYFQKDSMASDLHYGDRLIISSSFTEIKSRQNPGEFDYRKYLAMHSIFLQSYIKSGKWALLERNKGNLIKEMALNIRERFLEIFRTYEIKGDEYAVAGALILGYNDKLDQDLLDVYSGSGAMHILSVSGMHVGVVFIVLNFLLAFLDRSKKGKYIKPVILTLLIWFYAAITGFSPAVNRAATMISFVIAGKMMGRNTNIYNTLAASALVLLAYNPLLVADAGFQLSYIAVFGIVLLQKKIHLLWQPDNWLLAQVWILVTVSVAAQIATFPLSILYFHQFPNYFLLTNLIVVPFSNFIIYCGMLVLLTSFYTPLAALLSKAFVYMLYGLNTSIRFVEGLPYSVTKSLTLTIPETVLLYIVIAFFIMFLFSRHQRMLKLGTVFSILFFLFLAFNRYDAVIQKRIIVYNIKKSTAVDFIDGKDHVFITDSILKMDSKVVKTHVSNNWTELRLKEPLQVRNEKMNDSSFEYDNSSMLIRQNIIQFINKRIAFVNATNYRDVSDEPLQVDYLVISDNINTGIEELLDTYNPKLIIFDSSNSLKRTENWIEECNELNIPCYAVLKSGAFVEDI